MKNRLISGIIFIILGLFIAVGPQTVFPVCGVHTAAQSAEQTSMPMNSQETDQSEQCAADGDAMSASMNMMMKCHGTGQAALGLGALIAVSGVLLILLRSKQTRLGLSIALFLNGILALLIPTALIGVCDGAQMSCRMLALPALTILSSLAIIAAAANAVYLYQSDKKERQKNEAAAVNH
ncbi:protein of unknown function [Sporobacter termitidis DSM 10068]|uniref:DUF4418 domain-containing protein n=1 Tax=Sporobacter termitidis DSM 10068 TaxID=1123282 RepID=A0A1M5VHN0_9FIRM|nr:DUF4418 family protein [Sporobacter termitidis]SHH74736.1 protein of unknown function [Sporobacter termitidis DSM 10068]